jgi:hypothetical protein
MARKGLLGALLAGMRKNNSAREKAKRWASYDKVFKKK